MRVAREALPFVAVLAAAAVAVGFWSLWAASLPLALALFCLWFFRDPERRAPTDPRAILSPADGQVVRAGAGRVSVFLNLLNVHVCRSPVSGRVRSVVHTPGRFMAAYRDAASEHNERTTLELEGETTRLRLVLVAGLVARRIVSWVHEGQQLEAGQRVGLIRFGSRADVDLPSGAEIVVRVGHRVRAGTTVIARLPATRDGGVPRGSP